MYATFNNKPTWFQLFANFVGSKSETPKVNDIRMIGINNLELVANIQLPSQQRQEKIHLKCHLWLSLWLYLIAAKCTQSDKNHIDRTRRSVYFVALGSFARLDFIRSLSDRYPIVINLIVWQWKILWFIITLQTHKQTSITLILS